LEKDHAMLATSPAVAWHKVGRDREAIAAMRGTSSQIRAAYAHAVLAMSYDANSERVVSAEAEIDARSGVFMYCNLDNAQAMFDR
jgi:hypothetical protein